MVAVIVLFIILCVIYESANTLLFLSNLNLVSKLVATFVSVKKKGCAPVSFHFI